MGSNPIHLDRNYTWRFKITMMISMSQPEHFPYLGYFQKMKNSDLFIVMDNVKYGGPKSFQNRNRFTYNGVPYWFTVPVQKGSNEKLINEVLVLDDHHWRKKIVTTMKQKVHLDLTWLYEPNRLVDINMNAINLCREILGIETEMVLASSIPVSGAKAELVYNIAKYFSAEKILSGPGARSYFEQYDFKDVQIQYTNPITNFESSVTFLADENLVQQAKDLISNY